MTPTSYIAAILTMENQNTDGIRERVIDRRTIRMLHALLGINTENGELQDQFKKYLIYGKPLDYVNLIEEMGDLMWYMALLCDVLQVSLEQVMDTNIAKLRKRYPEGYSHARALHRDLESERVILENGKGEGSNDHDLHTPRGASHYENETDNEGQKYQREGSD